MKNLEYNSINNQIILKQNGKMIRFTSVEYLPDGWQGLEGQALAEWGIENQDNIDRFAILPFILFLEEEKVEVYHTNNGEYKVVHNGHIRGFTSILSAEEHLNKILISFGKEEIKLQPNEIYTPGYRGASLILEIIL